MLLTAFNLSTLTSRPDNPHHEPVEKRLRLYNQFPGSYPSIEAMIRDLARIREMGFKQVWVNPLYAPCSENFITPGNTQSPYAMQNERELNPLYKMRFEDLKAYTRRAKELGLVPLFDFVARHVAIDHPLVQRCPTWFKRHPNGNFVIHGMDENYQLTMENPWSDVATFDYSNPDILQQIFTDFWKPFIDFNIRELGFSGARLDAVGHVSRQAHEILLPYIDHVCEQVHGTPAYLVAETVGNASIDQDLVTKGLVTHTMNSAYWMPGPEGHNNNEYDIWKNDANWYAHTKGVLQQVAPTAGHAGSHDEVRYPHYLRQKGITHPIVLKQRMLEKIMVSAFGSDGGHILAYGDEYGVEQQVDLHAKKVIKSSQCQYDLCKEIRAVNELLSALPPPSYPEWTQRVFYQKYPELVIFIVHQGKGFTGRSHVIIGNSYNDEDKGIIVDQNMLNEIMLANGRNDTPEKLRQPEKVFLCGKIEMSHDLSPEVYAGFYRSSMRLKGR